MLAKPGSTRPRRVGLKEFLGFPATLRYLKGLADGLLEF